MITVVGRMIKISSDKSTLTPQSEKKTPTPIGDTSIGRTGKKYRVVSNGQKKATPKPPLVTASSSPCDIPARESTIKMAANRLLRLKYGWKNKLHTTAAINKSNGWHHDAPKSYHKVCLSQNRSHPHLAISIIQRQKTDTVSNKDG